MAGSHSKRRTLRLRLIVVGVFFGGFWPFVNPSEPVACMCVAPPPAKEAAAQAALVFVGKAVAGEVIAPESPPGYESRKFHFQRAQVLKGTGETTIDVFTGIGGGDCGFDFTLGRFYLVYTVREADRYHTSRCSRTKELSSAGQGEVRELSTPE